METLDSDRSDCPSKTAISSGSSAPSEIDEEWSDTETYAMMLISTVKPSKGTADQEERNANTPYCKHSHDRDWQCVDTCPTVGFQHLPQGWPQDEIQPADKQERSEQNASKHTN